MGWSRVEQRCGGCSRWLAMCVVCGGARAEVAVVGVPGFVGH